MTIFTFGSSRKKLSNCELVRVVLCTFSGSMEMQLLTTSVICEPLTAQPFSYCSEVYEHLCGLEFADVSDGVTLKEIDLLIGSNYYWQFATGQVAREESGPVVVETKLELVLSGTVSTTESCTLLTAHVLQLDSQGEESLNDTMRAFWELESMGVSTPNQCVYRLSLSRMGVMKCAYHGRDHALYSLTTMSTVRDGFKDYCDD